MALSLISLPPSDIYVGIGLIDGVAPTVCTKDA